MYQILYKDNWGINSRINSRLIKGQAIGKWFSSLTLLKRRRGRKRTEGKERWESGSGGMRVWESGRVREWESGRVIPWWLLCNWLISNYTYKWLRSLIILFLATDLGLCDQRMNHEGEGIEGETEGLGEIVKKTSSRECRKDQKRGFLRVRIKTWIHGQFKESVYSKRTVLVVPVHGIYSLLLPLSSFLLFLSPSRSFSSGRKPKRERVTWRNKERIEWRNGRGSFGVNYSLLKPDTRWRWGHKFAPCSPCRSLSSLPLLLLPSISLLFSLSDHTSLSPTFISAFLLYSSSTFAFVPFSLTFHLASIPLVPKLLPASINASSPWSLSFSPLPTCAIHPGHTLTAFLSSNLTKDRCIEIVSARTLLTRPTDT